MNNENVTIDELDRFTRWLETLSPIDGMNVNALLSLGVAEGVIDKCPEGKYKEMMLIGIRIQKQATDKIKRVDKVRK